MKFKDVTRVCDYCNKEFSKSSFYTVTTTKCNHDGQKHYNVDRMRSLVFCEDCGEMLFTATSITI